MSRLAFVCLMLTATGGCADDADPADASWPCASYRTEGGTPTTYQWDEHHNMLRREFVDADEHVLDTWEYDPTGQIAILETHLGWQDFQSHTRRELVDGRVVKEVRVDSDPQGPSTTITTTYRYEGERLVEKLTGGTRTVVTYPAPDTRLEVMRNVDGTGRETRTTWIGEPWTEMHQEEVGSLFWEDSTRVLDDAGRVLHQDRWYYHKAPARPDETLDIERGPNGAPTREARVNSMGLHLTTYTTECPM